MEHYIWMLPIIREIFRWFFSRYNKKYIYDKKITERSTKVFPEEVKISLVNHYLEGLYFLKHNEYVSGLIFFQEKKRIIFLTKN